MIREVWLRKTHIQIINDECSKHTPDEACGVLIGYPESDNVVVKKVMPVTNARPSNRSFELDAKEHYAAWNMAEKEGMDIVGIYHTHPRSVARPSLWDEKSMEHYHTLWIIAGIDGIKGFEWDGGIKHVKIVEVS